MLAFPSRLMESVIDLKAVFLGEGRRQVLNMEHTIQVAHQTTAFRSAPGSRSPGCFICPCLF